MIDGIKRDKKEAILNSPKSRQLPNKQNIIKTNETLAYQNAIISNHLSPTNNGYKPYNAIHKRYTFY